MRGGALRRAHGVLAFTLAEAMLAMLFISIAFFAYVSLHIRIIHSNFKLEGRQTIKEKVASDMAYKLALSRKGQKTTQGLVDPEAALRFLGIPSSNTDGPAGSTTTANSTSSTGSSSFPSFQAYNQSTSVGAGPVSTAYNDGGFKESSAYKGSVSVNDADWGRMATGDSSLSIKYEEGAVTQNPAGLPPNLYLVETNVEFQDSNGPHTYYVDSYQRTELTRW